MRFVEGQTELPHMPAWAEFLLTFGYQWPQIVPAKRRIVLISMPCDSAAAGLVALGIMRKRLEKQDGSDKSRHLDRLYACAKAEKSGIRIKHRARKGYFRVDTGRTDGVWFIDAKDQSFKVFPANAYDWRFEDEPFVEVKDGAEIPFHSHYAGLVKGGGVILKENLRQSDSVLCLAGRTSGEASTEALMSQVSFEVDGSVVSLAQLLTVFSWSTALVSRITFFNPRLSTFDRPVRAPEVVVVDGHRAALRVMTSNDMAESDIVAVYHRAVERDDLEEIGGRIASLQQWYDLEPSGQESDPVPPKGINVLKLVRR